MLLLPCCCCVAVAVLLLQCCCCCRVVAVAVAVLLLQCCCCCSVVVAVYVCMYVYSLSLLSCFISSCFNRFELLEIACTVCWPATPLARHPRVPSDFTTQVRVLPDVWQSWSCLGLLHVRFILCVRAGSSPLVLGRRWLKIWVMGIVQF